MAGDSKVEQLHATIVTLEKPAGGWEFSAICQSRYGTLRVLLKAKPLAVIKPGDDLIFKPMLAGSAPRDDLTEVTTHPDASSAALAALLTSKGNIYRSSPAARPLYSSGFSASDAMLWAQSKGMAIQGDKSGVTVLTRPDAQQSGDPIIQWVVAKFDDPSIRHLRNAADIITLPGAINDATADIRRSVMAPNTMLDLVTSILPDYLLANEELRTPALRSGAGDLPHALMPNGFAKERAVGLIFPYSIRENSIMFARGLSGWSYNGSFPKCLVSAKVRFTLSALHEMAHLLRVNIEEFVSPNSDRGDISIVQRSEAFADSLSLLIFVTQTGNAAEARRVAHLRSVASLGVCNTRTIGAEDLSQDSEQVIRTSHLTHMTGRACHAAIERALDLRAEARGKPIPLLSLVDAALEITDKNQLAPIADYLLVNFELERANPFWRSLKAQDLANLVSHVVEAQSSKLIDVRAISAEMTGALMGVSHSFTQLSDIPLDVAKRQLQNIARIDFNNHLEETLKTNGRPAAREAIDAMIEDIKDMQAALDLAATGARRSQKGWLPRHSLSDVLSGIPTLDSIRAREGMMVDVMYQAALEVRQTNSYALAPLPSEPTKQIYVATRPAGDAPGLGS